MKTSEISARANLKNDNVSVKSTLRVLGPVLLSAMLLSVAPAHSAEAVPSKANANSKAQINRVYVRDGRLVKISSTTASSPALRSSNATVSRRGAIIDEPEFIWNRTTLTWMKNPRYGMVKIVAASTSESDSATRKRG